MKTLNLTQAQFDWMIAKERWTEEAEGVENFDHIFSVVRNLMTGHLFYVKIKK